MAHREANDIERMLYLHFPGEWGIAHGTMGERQALVKRQKQKRGSSGVSMGKAGKAAQDWLV